MRVSIVAGSALAAVGLAVLASVTLDLSFERAALLAPVIVVCAGAIAGLVVLWTKAALGSVGRRRSSGEEPSDDGRTVADRRGMDDPPLYAGTRAHAGRDGRR